MHVQITVQICFTKGRTYRITLCTHFCNLSVWAAG